MSQYKTYSKTKFLRLFAANPPLETSGISVCFFNIFCFFLHSWKLPSKTP